MDLTFETKCYENDWKFMLQTNYLDEMVRRCNQPFLFKQLIINNVKDKEQVRLFAEKKVTEKVIDAYYFAEDYAEEALRFFQIEKESFGRGYYYSISELVGLYLCKTKYLLHFSSDAIIDKDTKNLWIPEAIALMGNHPEYVVANPVWNHNYDEAKKESHDEIEEFYVGYGFSDQCYLVDTNVFRKPIYSEHHPASDRYPKYGGELFEKRVDSFMRNHEFKRITYKYGSYLHKNFPKNALLRMIKLLQMRKHSSSDSV